MPGTVVTEVVVTCQFLPPDLRQSPRYTSVPEGGSVNITCSSNSSLLYGVYLAREWPMASKGYVIYYSSVKTPTVDKAFETRVGFSGSQQNLTVTLSSLQPADTGLYTCQDAGDSQVSGHGTLVLVSEKLSRGENQAAPFGLSVALAVGCFLAGLGLGVVCALRTQIKQLCSGKSRSAATVVYEDMSCSQRPTLSRPNPYQ
ncbi:T-cell antigen CD7 [Echinops telfairi]|uniref:T-cell antigen CD7 n=1 Tax=Echinops telfairi TaxID=9371 RepID=A0AC55DUN9_ECHTE|nr:T-cell antigen CD7 [Echinops telfairi]